MKVESNEFLNVVNFFFQAEDGIRDYKVTGVQTCALPICVQVVWFRARVHVVWFHARVQVVWFSARVQAVWFQIGRASCRERV